VFAAIFAAAGVRAAEISIDGLIAELDLAVDLADDDIPLGGLSGLTYDPACGLFYAVSDDRGYIAPPRFYTFVFDPESSEVRPLEVVTLLGDDGEVIGSGDFDAEAVALAPDGTLWVATEGVSHRMVPPRIVGYRLDGTILAELVIPDAYLPTEAGHGVRSNHGFEGLTVSPDGDRIVAAVETALKQDGPTADLQRGSVSRMVVFDASSGRVISERAYRGEPVPDQPLPSDAYRSIGVSDVLALDARWILVLERSFSAGVGNRVRIYLADLDSGDDLTGLDAMPERVRPVDKRLVIDLHDLGIEPNNLEGLAIGPTLSDGRMTLVLIGDNNFQPEVQPNQLLVLGVSGIEPPVGDRTPADVVTVQGADHISPLVGRCVQGVEGVVTAILGRKTGQAFWIQQTPDDGDQATSEGIFVTALDGLDKIGVGDRVRLQGRVEEPLWRMELPVTRLVADGLEITDRGRDLPPPVVLGSGGRPIPTPNIDDDGLTLFEPDTDAIDYFESLEGMRVRVDRPVVVGPTSRYGEIVVLGDDGAHSSPRSIRGGVVLGPKNAHPERIIIDDRLVPDPPAVTVGGEFRSTIDGVLHYSFGNYKLLNTDGLAARPKPDFEPAATTLSADERHITVATFNVENLSFVSEPDKLADLAETIARRLGSPTVLALQEIQDDSGPEDDGVVTAGETLARLVRAVTDAGGPAYEWAQIDPGNNEDGGRPGSNIRVALLFDPNRVVVAERNRNDRENPHLIGATDPAFVDSRKPLVVEMEVDRQRVLFVVCHLRSKGGDDPLFGRRQPPKRWSEDQRVPQAEEVRKLLDGLLGVDPDARVIVLGDLNDFEFSQAVGTISAPPMVNLMERLPESRRSTYVFQGNSQILDHIVVSPALADGAEIEVVQVNADFPASERASDHDPVIARLSIGR
jgi:endonuclease/exonuclease/phosphatase family metal-dependent hydrolase